MASIWGGDSPAVGWNQNAWASNTISVSLTGLSATSTVGTLTTEVKPGWGTLDWGENGWGTVESAVYPLTGLSATASVGALDPADQEMGLTGVSATSSVGSLSESS